MATCLAFDTAQGWCAGALIGDGQASSRIDQMARGQVEHLMPMLEEMLEEAGLGWRDLDVIGVGIGPGNFTGIRISVAAARGLAMALEIPAIGVSAFEAAVSGPLPRWVAIEAPRDQVYLQRLDASGHGAPALVGASTLTALDAPLTRLADSTPEARITRIGELALARRHQPYARPAPLYVRPADAAPARDAPPVILA